MSTPRKIDSRTAAKRRAARRKRTREAFGRFFVILIVLVLVLGTASIAIVSQPTATVVAPTAAPPQPTANPQAQTLLTQGNQSYAAQNWQAAIQYYNAYLSLDPSGYTNADLLFYLGKSYLNVQPPQYLNALSNLQAALNINPNASWAQEARTLIDQNKDKVTLTPSVVITGTATITGSIGTPAPAAIKGTATAAPATKVP